MSSKRLVRSTDDRMIAGVAAGVANYAGIDATIVRLILALLVFFGGGGIPLYIVLWIVMPEENLMDAAHVDSDEEIIIEKGS